MNRRKFLIAAGALALPCAGLGLYLNDEPMHRAPVREGKVLADIHAHPSRYRSDRDTLEMLLRPGIVGLTRYTTESHPLTYEEAISRYSNLLTEIDRGKFARFRNAAGYILRTQEVSAGKFHILALGFDGNYLPFFGDARKAVDCIHRRNGIAVFNHPYIFPDRSFVRYRIGGREDEDAIHEACAMVDEVEAFNAMCISPTFGIVFPDMKAANRKADDLAKEFGFKGTVSSDAHSSLDQPKLCGIYLEAKGICVEKIKSDIKGGNFENDYRRYVSRGSFASGFLKR